LQPYSCKPDPAFEQLTSCTRTQTRNRGYDYSAVGTLMHNENGAIVFLKVKVAPVKISEDEIKKETVQLSGELGGKPVGKSPSYTSRRNEACDISHEIPVAARAQI
jgi:hypothetical protein